MAQKLIELRDMSRGLESVRADGNAKQFQRTRKQPIKHGTLTAMALCDAYLISHARERRGLDGHVHRASYAFIKAI
jgi:hypothetical protein